MFGDEIDVEQMLRHIAVRFLLPLTLFATLSAAALADDELDRCTSDDPKVSIPACTHIIESGVETGDFLGTLYGIRGLSYYKNGQYANAVADLSKKIRTAKNTNDRFPLIRLRAQIFLALNDYPHAVADYTEALRLKPNDVPSYNGRGYTFLKWGKYPSAITDYTEALNRQPEISQALYGRGLAKRAVRDLAGADIDIVHAKKVNRDIAESFADVETKLK
jgi:tetratricopeptide (TPR) repeat protein